MSLSVSHYIRTRRVAAIRSLSKDPLLRGRMIRQNMQLHMHMMPEVHGDCSGAKPVCLQKLTAAMDAAVRDCSGIKPVRLQSSGTHFSAAGIYA